MKKLTDTWKRTMNTAAFGTASQKDSAVQLVCRFILKIKWYVIHSQ